MLATAGYSRISRSQRGRIDTTKTAIRHSKNPFDGIGYAFAQAVKELRKEGINIVYNKEKCNYTVIR